MTARPEHAGELLSAGLDGELDPASQAWLDDHLASCEACAASLADLERTRALLRGLPGVDGSSFVEGFLARHRATVRVGAGFVGAAAVVLGLLALTAAVAQARIEPDVDAMVAAHHQLLDAVDGEAVGRGLPEGWQAVSVRGQAPPREVRRLAGHYSAPRSMPPMPIELVGHLAFDGSNLAWLVYRHHDSLVSVYEEPGVVAWNQLADGSPIDLDGRRGWLRRDGGHAVVVGQVGHLAVTVVADDVETAVSVATELPSRTRDSAWDRLHHACQRFVGVFTLRGR